MIMGASYFREAIWHCLTCNAKLSEFSFEVNNGTCDDCPKLTAIAPEFWKVIMHLAERGDFDALKTIEVYG